MACRVILRNLVILCGIFIGLGVTSPAAGLLFLGSRGGGASHPDLMKKAPANADARTKINSVERSAHLNLVNVARVINTNNGDFKITGNADHGRAKYIVLVDKNPQVAFVSFRNHTG